VQLLRRKLKRIGLVIIAGAALVGCQVEIVGHSPDMSQLMVAKGSIDPLTVIANYHLRLPGQDITCSGEAHRTFKASGFGGVGDRFNGTLRCNDGRKGEMELVVEGTLAGSGQGKDECGNVFRFVFDADEETISEKREEFETKIKASGRTWVDKCKIKKKAPPPAIAAKPAPSGKLEQQLALLKRLKDRGLINDTEYEAKKQVVLNRHLGIERAAIPSTPMAMAVPTKTAKMVSLGEIDFGTYHALVIGSNDYRYLPKLKTAAGDAKAVAALLTSAYGYKVTMLENATRSEILDALDTYREQLTEKDNLLIYYAGHGWLDEAGEEGYWLPVNARANRRTNWISNARITSTLRALNARHVLVVADSCYSGTLVRGIKVSQPTPDYIRRMAEKRARLVITSGGLEPVADSAGGGHSPFATAFLESLRNNDSILDGTQLFNQLRRPVMLKADQTPEYADVRKAGHEGGDFLFVRR
jgi:hypothetical protein